MKYLLVLAALIFSTQASAFGFGNTHNKFLTFSQSHAYSSAYARAYGGYGQGGGGGAGGNVAINERSFASMAYAPPAYPTATCLKAVSGGGSGVGFGFSFGTTYIDQECRLFEGGRAIINAKNNGFLQDKVDGETIADRMYMDVMCSAESMKPTRDCKIHNAKLEAAENTQTADTKTDSGPKNAASIPDEIVEEKKVSLDWPWNWGSDG